MRVIAGRRRGAGTWGRWRGSPWHPSSSTCLPAGARFREAVPRGHTAFAYVDHGDVRFGPEATAVRAPALVVFGDGDLVEASAGAEGGRFLLAAARPIGEPIARYGPFVMNTRAEIEEALQELRTGRFIREEARED